MSQHQHGYEVMFRKLSHTSGATRSRSQAQGESQSLNVDSVTRQESPLRLRLKTFPMKERALCFFIIILRCSHPFLDDFHYDWCSFEDCIAMHFMTVYF